MNGMIIYLSWMIKMTDSNKSKTGWYIDSGLVARFNNIVTTKKISHSGLADKYVKIGLSKEPSITLSERLNYQLSVLNLELSGLLNTFGVTVEGSNVHKLDILCAIITRGPRKKELSPKNKQLILSLFTVLEDIRAIDIESYDEFKPILSKYVRIKSEFENCSLFGFGENKE